MFLRKAEYKAAGFTVMSVPDANAQEGICGFSVLKKNEAAVAVWEKLLQVEGYPYQKVDEDEQLWSYFVERKCLE